MDQAVLVEQQQDEGKRLVEKLDQDGFGPSVAVWYYFSDVETWRLLLAGSALDPTKPEEAYAVIAHSLGALRPPAQSMSIADVEIVSERDQVVTALRTMVHTGKNISSIRLSDNFVNGLHIPQALAYRIT